MNKKLRIDASFYAYKIRAHTQHKFKKMAGMDVYECGELTFLDSGFNAYIIVYE